MMHPKIKEWLKAEEDVESAKELANHLLEQARMADQPASLRPAKPEDIREGNIIWYPDADPGCTYWMMVEDVLRPKDEYKAYTAHDGCRYGLDGAFVEIET